MDMAKPLPKRANDSAPTAQLSVELSPVLMEYRNQLLKAAHSSSEAYDKAVVTLSGGALALSLAFMKDIVREPRADTKYLLVAAWISFAVSIALILLSLLTSKWALNKAVQQVDSGKIYNQRAGGKFSAITEALNVLAGLGFLSGVGFLASFVLTNMK